MDVKITSVNLIGSLSVWEKIYILESSHPTIYEISDNLCSSVGSSFDIVSALFVLVTLTL